MKIGLPIIAESNFGKEAIPVIKSLLNKYNYKSITIRFEADLKVLHERFLNREYSDERHTGLVSNGIFDDYENFKKTHEKSREFKIDDNEILVDTTDFTTVDINAIIKQLQDQMK